MQGTQPLVISLKYKNKVTVKKFPFMKVQNNVMLSFIPGGDFVGGEMVWWRDDQIPLYWTAFLNFIFRSLNG